MHIYGEYLCTTVAPNDERGLVQQSCTFGALCSTFPFVGVCGFPPFYLFVGITTSGKLDLNLAFVGEIAEGERVVVTVAVAQPLQHARCN